MTHLTSPVRRITATLNELWLPRACTLAKYHARNLRRWIEHHWVNAQVPKLASQTCEIYLGATGEASLARCREVLQMQITLSPQQLKRFFQTQVGQTLLTRLGRLINWPDDATSQATLRRTLSEMVAHADKFSVMSLLYQVANTLQLNLDQLLLTAKQVDLLLETTDSLLEELKRLSEAEAVATAWQPPTVDDPRLPGASGIERSVFYLQGRQRWSFEGRKRQREFRVLLYTPTQWPFEKTPVVIISHGLAARPDDLSVYSEHLASHGYVVAIPQHPGSDANQVREMLSGEATEVFEIDEFIDRPLDVSDVLDALERCNAKDYQGRLDLSAVGVIGQSFGGYTALALAGATIDFESLEQACSPALDTPNISMLLQCRALDLPRQQQQSLKDDRVKAVLTLDPIGRNLFGEKGMATVDVPILIVTGSEDKAAPMALEPIQLFPWLRTPQRYLAVIRGKSHIHDLGKLLSALKLQLTRETAPLRLHPPIIDSYFNGLSVAFFEAYLRHQDPIWLQAAYARSISRSPYDLYLISQSSSREIEKPLQQFATQLSQLHWQTVTIQHSEGLFNASGGFSLYYQTWLPTETLKAVVVIVPGLGGHSGLFSNVVKALVPYGYGVYSFDVRGNGRSPGQRGYISRWDDYREDLAHFIHLVKTDPSLLALSRQPDPPCFLMGHSVGGLIALDYALRYPEPLAGLMVTAPPFGTSGLSGVRLWLGRALSRLWPRFSLSTGLGHIPPSLDRAVVIAYAHDPLRHTRGTARFATEYLHTLHWLNTHAHECSLPLLMLHGTHDEIAVMGDAQAFFEKVGSSDKVFRAYAGSYHELHDDLNHDQVLADLTAWLETHTAGIR
jgi:predicted dienelactone hydrolase